MSCSHPSLNILMHGDRGWTVFKLVKGGDSCTLCQQKKVSYPLHLKGNVDSGGISAMEKRKSQNVCQFTANSEK